MSGAYDLILLGGRLFDPGAGLDRVADIAFRDGVIAGIGDYSRSEAARVLDAAGLLVTPGLIDVHCHLYPYTDMGIGEANCFTAGVTAAADAGSLGWGNFASMRGHAGGVRLREYFYLNISADGIPVSNFCEQVDPDFDGGAAARAFRRIWRDRPAHLLGLKLRMQRNITRDLGLRPLEWALAMCEELGTHLVVHCTDPAVPLADILTRMRPGDIVTHIYNGLGDTILDPDGHLIPELLAARERGVLFDCGNDRIHFAYKVALPALEQGFYPDFIGSDLTTNAAFGPICTSFSQLLSKWLALGMPLDTLIEKVTRRAAVELGMAGKIGTLTPGAFGDAALLKLEEGSYSYPDSYGGSLTGSVRLRPVATALEGKLVWCDPDY